MTYVIIIAVFAVVVAGFVVWDAQVFPREEMFGRFLVWFAIWGSVALAVCACAYFGVPIKPMLVR